MYDRHEIACHLCFRDKVLKEWITENAIGRAKCPWCGRHGRIVYLHMLSEAFRDVASLYVPADGPEAADRGELIGDLLDYQWEIFAEELTDLRQELAVVILTADLREKELFDFPDFDGLFFSDHPLSLEEAWDEKADAVLTGEMPKPPDPQMIEEQRETFGQFEFVFEDLSSLFKPALHGPLYRARRYDDRRHIERFTDVELGAPPPHKATAGRANQRQQPVLYLANNKSTAIAEVRPWKGAAIAVAEMQANRDLLLIDLSQKLRIKSPFFVDLLKWRLDLANLVYRLGQDMSRPVMPHEPEVLYKPTQLLTLMIQSAGYDGCIYPSAMGSGKNYVLFDTSAAKVGNIEHVRVKSAAFFSAPLAEYESPYEEGPYDHMLT